MLQNSVELVRRVTEGISETAAANPTTAVPVDLQLLHVAIVFGDGGEREIKAVRAPSRLFRLSAACLLASASLKQACNICRL